ncbi:HpcH/HpaI aldolase family protein [Cedecea colo]|nr:aldolase/citrate lyase family protein [Cedecea colo]
MSTSILPNQIPMRERMSGPISRGHRPVGIFVGSIDPAMTEVAAAAGMDFVAVDEEHATNDLQSISNHIRAAEATGIFALVRVRKNDDATLQSFLDIGASGFLVPHIDTAGDAERAVRATHFAPVGSRGMCPNARASLFNWRDQGAHAGTINDGAIVIPIIESPKAVENIAEIVAVDGIDMVLFGPGDLSSEMGVPVDHPSVFEAQAKVEKAVRDAGKQLMVTLFTPEGGDAMCLNMDYMIMFDALTALREKYPAYGKPVAQSNNAN